MRYCESNKCLIRVLCGRHVVAWSVSKTSNFQLTKSILQNSLTTILFLQILIDRTPKVLFEKFSSDDSDSDPTPNFRLTKDTDFRAHQTRLVDFFFSETKFVRRNKI